MKQLCISLSKFLAFSLLFIIYLALLFSCSSDKSALKKSPFFDAETVFKEANEKIEKGLYEEAREILQNVKVQDTSGEFAPIAQLRIGDSYFQEGLYEEAAVEYREFLKLHKHHKYASYAQYQLAMSYFKRIKTVDVSYAPAKNALHEFEKLLTNYPRNPYIDVAESRINMCKRILAEYELYVGNFYFKKKSYNAAVMRYNTLLREYPDSKREPEALYYLGLSYMNMDEPSKAVSALSRLVEKYPTNSLSKKAQEIIASIQKNTK
jgi:outer membrane protein assembly factor BamD